MALATFLAGALSHPVFAGSEYFTLDGKAVPNGNPIEQNGCITHVTSPALRVSVSNAAKVNGTVLLFPGGGYTILSAIEEGADTAAKLNGFGYDVVTLQYHINAGGATRDLALQDGLAAWRLLKNHPEYLGVHGGRTVLMGYSAGGHLAARLVQNLGASAQVQPDDLILVYPAYLEEAALGATAPTVQPPPRPTSRLIVVMGSKDQPEWLKGAHDYATAWSNAGGSTIFEEFKDVKHGFAMKANLTGDIAQWPAALNYLLENGTKPGVGPFNTALPWFLKNNAGRLSEFSKSKASDMGSIVFLGDSITRQWNLAAAFPGLKIANRGISGDTTRGMFCRLQDNVLDLHPKAVVFLGGINDLGQEPKGTPETIAANVRSILEKIQAANPNTPVLLCETLPSKIAPLTEITAVNAAVDKVIATFPNVHRVKTYAAFLAPDGSPNNSLFLDGTHPNPAGYEIWKGLLEPALERYAK